MKSLLLIFLLLFLKGQLLPAQVAKPATINSSATTGSTYAVVVGISAYQSPGIPQLEYAHRDAQSFADYLRSKAGGAVPEDNIRVLLNENATYAAIYDALNWLLASAHKDDLVYFYFSGHGDMENTTIYKLGFLLSYNTPRTNYINNAVRIEDLNNIANTLSVKINAKVILITDACHSGKLAGADYNGTFLAADQLRTVQNKETRITSCAPDQLSAEDEGWGGGRGVFSYYLVNGLKGLADKNQDKIITVNEIKDYLDSSLAVDALLLQKAVKQSPVIKGNDLFALATVDNVSLNTLKKQLAPVMVSKGAAPLVLGALAPLPMQPQTYFFNLFQNQHAEELIDFTALNKVPGEDIPFACLHMLADTLRAMAADGRPALAIDSSKIALLDKTMRENKDAFARFSNKLAVLLSDRGQEIINHYLEGDAAELERRRYYNSKSNGYDVYPDMFSVAMKLTPPANYLYRILEVKLHYFSGVAARLKIPTVPNARPLLATALAEQQKAFALEENAAYIQNELGVLSLLNNALPAAEKYFVRATEIAPKWAIPWSNLAGLYAALSKYDQATAAAATATALQPDFPGSYTNSGWVYEKTGRLLQAEELFRKSIQLNSRDYVPFERLGYVSMTTTQYALADSFFYEADKRKKGFHFNDNLKHYIPMPIALAEAVTVACPFDTLDIGKTDVLGNFVWALRNYETGYLAGAEKRLKAVIALDKTNPLAFHYLGRLLYWQQRWEEAAIIFNLSLTSYLDADAFKKYVDSVTAHMPNTKSKDCISQTYRHYYYPGIEDHYFSGRLYEAWNHPTEAEAHYRIIIKINPAFVDGYYLLWNMLEKTGRCRDAEQVLYSYAPKNQVSGNQYLYAFYKRMTVRYPDEGEWFYKGGVFAYNLCADSAASYPYDKKRIVPDSNVEKYIIDIDDFTKPEIRQKDADELMMPGINEVVRSAPHIIYPRTDGIAYLKMADSLMAGDDDARADINVKTGDLYVWQGLAVKAPPYYEQSVSLSPDNANTRLQLINIYDTTYQFTRALVHLDSLYNRHQINFDKQLLRAKYFIYQSRFDEADRLLKDAKQLHPFIIPTIVDLNGQLLLLSHQPQKALAFYRNYLALDTANAGAAYTIARIYALIGNTTDAWKWLELAMRKGFRYKWVLQLDDTWQRYRKQSRWTALQQRFPAKKYATSSL